MKFICLKTILISSLLMVFLCFGCELNHNTYHSPKKERSPKILLNDSIIYSKVKTRFSKNRFIDARLVDVDVFNSVVTLTGTVKTESMRRAAGDIARGINRVKWVNNYIKIGYKKKKNPL